jgi:integrase
MKFKLTASSVRGIPLGHRVTDTDVQGFCASAGLSGISFAFRYPSPIYKGKHRLIGIGRYPSIAPDEARRIAKRFAAMVAQGIDPLVDRSHKQAAAKLLENRKTFEQAANRYLEEVSARGLRTADERRRFFAKTIFPLLGSKFLDEISRSEILRCIDHIRKTSSKFVALRMHAFISAFFTWHALRDESFRSPIVKGMAPTSPAQYSRERTLSKQEIRDLWTALNNCDEPYASIVRALMLTGARRDEISAMTWREVRDDRIVLPGSRTKSGREFVIPLNQYLRLLIAKQMKRRELDSAEYVFSTQGGRVPFSGFSKSKGRLDRMLKSLSSERQQQQIAPWRLHDLRRTARTIMSEGGVMPDHAERVLGHSITGIQAVYDRHDYFTQKQKALEVLESALREIVGEKLWGFGVLSPG